MNAQQIPPSPSVQQSPLTHATPSTLGAAGSPSQTPRPLVLNTHGSAEAIGRREDQKKMRSSIACYICRRSKTKCDNNGIHGATGALAPCKSCVASKKECIYPPSTPSTSSQPLRRESTATTAGDEVWNLFHCSFFCLFVTVLLSRATLAYSLNRRTACTTILLLWMASVHSHDLEGIF